MSLREIFAKPIDRPIEGVIKADDNASLRQEVEEYVLTQEIEKRLDHFLSAYNNYTGANGVWLSGFFGSGKSHLLKMLALLLENREIDGKRVLDEFLNKCEEDEFLRAEINNAAGVNSQSILFNIDQKADVISKTQIDALLSVFMKVFDEACGYYGKQGYIARFERDLDERGQLADFHKAYEALANKPWERGREEWLMEQSNVSKAFAQVSGQEPESARGILQKYREDYRVSIEDFAEMVKRHIDRRGKDFRLNFFVDEVGQFIAGNVKLMLNLQTIAESLATKCNGQAWVIVTAQEDMDSVIGGMSRTEGDDFTKIQARFANRLKLTSTNVAEVIQRRLLKKTEASKPELQSLYEQHTGNLRTLFGFTDGSITYKNFRDDDHFVDCYPFIPYQFDLFQSVIQGLSVHNVFEGKHSSVGERSMLAVFQQVAKQIQDQTMGQLATFDLMFEGMRTAIKSGAIQPILTLERNAEGEFAPRLLKTLFLVKYVQGFKATVHNLSILMLESFEEDQRELSLRVQEALNRLEQQTYIQRSGELYEYLTNEEKDVEQEIKNIDIENADVLEKLADVCFDNVLRTRKIRYEDNGQDYPYTRKLDDKAYTREQELAIHIISPLHEYAGNIDRLRGYSAYNENELVIILPSDDRLVSDMAMLLKTEKYFKQNYSSTQKDEVRRILTDKNAQNQKRLTELQERARSLLGTATFMVAGTEIELASEDATSRIIQSFQELIGRNYPNLRMLRGHIYTEEQIATNLTYGDGELLDSETLSLPEPEQELLSFIQGNERSGVRSTLKSALEKFERKPYGWYQAAILCTLARLIARGKVDLRADSNLLEHDHLERALRNSHGYANVQIAPQAAFTAGQVGKLKSFYAEFFHEVAPANEPKALGQATANGVKVLIGDLQVLMGQENEFPFLQGLQPSIERLKPLGEKNYDWFLTELPAQEDDLLDLKEDLIDPIRAFMSGPHKDIYRKARKFLREQAPNIRDLRTPVGGVAETTGSSSGPDADPDALNALLDDPQCFKGDRLSAVRGQISALSQRIEDQLNAERDTALFRLTQLRDALQGMPECAQLTPEQQRSMVTTFERAEAEINAEQLMPMVRDRINRFEQQEYTQLLSQITRWAAPEPTPAQDAEGKEAAQPAQPPRFVNIRNVPVGFRSPLLKSPDDVDRYVNALREMLLEEIHQGKQIQV